MLTHPSRHAQSPPPTARHTLSTQSHAELASLFALLDDPDPVVQRSVQGRLLAIGEDVAPTLRSLEQSSNDPDLLHNIRSVHDRLGLQRFRREIRRLTDIDPDQDIDLEAGAFAVALLGYPELRIGEYSDRLDVMASRLRNRIWKLSDPVEVIAEINRYLVEELGFRGTAQVNYYDPENSYMNRVMDRRIGIPVTLSVVYLLLARRLNLPLYGVNFPMHFLLTYRTQGGEFYIDAFGGGTVLDHGDVRRMLRRLGFEFREEYLRPMTNRQIVSRMLANLARITTDRVEELEMARMMVEG